MRKLLLLIALITFSFGNAQVNTQVSNYAVCSSNNNGIAQFDLNTKTPEILGNLDPTIHNVTFYVTVTDAQNGVNPIIASNYINSTPFSQQIYVRVVNTQTTIASFTSFTLIVNSAANAGSDGTATVCDTVATELNLFGLIIGEQPGGVWTRTSGTGGIFNASTATFMPTVGATLSSFSYTIPATSTCASDSSNVTLVIENCSPICLPPSNLSVTSITSTSAVLSWTSATTSTVWQILAMPFGAPAPTASTQGIYSQSNPFVIVGLSPDTCYTFYVRTICGTSTGSFSDWSAPSSFCMYDCTNNAQCPESLQLIAFIDLNANGIKDSNETIFNSGNYVYNINNSSTPLFGYASNTSFSIFDSNPTNTYNLSFAVPSILAPYYSSATTYSNISIPTGSGSTSYYFPIIQLQPYNDLEVQLISYGNPRPGFNHYNTIYYKNKGTQTVSSGTVTFTKSATVSITNISQTGTTPNATGFTYNFTNLLPNEQRVILVEMLVPTIPTVALGDLVSNTASSTPTVGDAFPLDNTTTLSQIIVGSYDPNDKAEAHGGKIAINNFSSNDYLEYTIQFENTGTASAQFIRVEDLLDASLNPNSIVMLSSSHNYNLKRVGNKLTWNFFNINLPTTTANPSSSHGFVHFKIKPTAGYTVGTIIPNSAAIYFEYNPPIFTNTFNTQFVAALNNTTFANQGFTLYPNPAQKTLQLQSNSDSTIDQITITDLSGKVILVQTQNTTTVNVEQLSNGMYFLEIQSGDQKVTKKFIKE